MSSNNNKKYDFSGKVALVTGSSAGLGEAMALQFAQYGAKVVITGRSAERLDKVANAIEKISPNGLKPLQVIGDLQNDQSLPKKLIDETIGKFGRLDILVNNAGGATPQGTLASPNLLEEFDNVFNLNVRDVVALTQLAAPHLEKTKGNIVNISTIGSVKPYQLCYSSAKAAVDMVTKTSALELGPKGIRVNSVNPGFIRTDFLRSMGLEQKGQQGDFYADQIEKSLMKRIGDPDDIANLVSFLTSDDAKNITGSIMFSDSGFLVQN